MTEALRPCGDVSTARPKEMVQCLSEELMTVPAKVLDKAICSLFALTFHVPGVQSRAAVLNESLEQRKGEVAEGKSCHCSEGEAKPLCKVL